jgi:hypothetical protein
MNLVERVVHRYASSFRTGTGTLPIWHLVSSAKRALTGLAHGNIYENLKSLADTLSSLDRSDPPLDSNLVREGAHLARRLLEAEKQLFSAMLDVQNLYVALERAETGSR